MAPFWYFVRSAAMLAALFSLLRHTAVEILFLGAARGLLLIGLSALAFRINRKYIA